MDVILHLGAHRTGTSTLQQYLDDNCDNLAKMRLAYWGPDRTRSGLMAGLFTPPAKLRGPAARRARRAEGRVALTINLLARDGHQALIVSDENMLGTVRNNLSELLLYPEAEMRLKRFSGAFEAACTQVCIAIRSYENYWASSLAYSVWRGHEMPHPDRLERLTVQPHRWRDVITAAARVFPDARIVVWPFETFGSQPERALSLLTGAPVPLGTRAKREWVNVSPGRAQLRALLSERGDAAVAQLPGGDGRWQPFSPAQITSLRAQYIEDLVWLRAGADGLATFIESAGTHPRPMTEEEGHDHERPEGNLGQAG